MTAVEQLKAAFLQAPGAVRRLEPAGWRLAALYAGAAIALLVGVGVALTALEGDARRLIFTYLFPAELQGAADFLAQYVFASQTQQIIINALASGTLILVSLFLFFLKERLSAQVERDMGLNPGRTPRELPLVHQGYEEVKLLLLYIAAFFVVFWIGHDAATWRKVVATIASYLVMFFTWAVDFLAPVMQRHGIRYGQVIKAIFKRPLASFCFGAVFALPVAIAAHVASKNPGLGAGGIVALVFAVNIVAILWACVAGTWMGAQLLPVAEASRPATIWSRVLAWVSVLGVVAFGTFVALSLASSLHGKSQILKLSYDVDWASVRVEAPKVASLLAGKVEAAVAFDVAITNPTAFPVEIEENRLELSDGTDVIARSQLSPMAIAPGETRDERVRTSVVIEAGSFLDGVQLDPKKWRLTLYFEIADGFDFPVYLK